MRPHLSALLAFAACGFQPLEGEVTALPVRVDRQLVLAEVALAVEGCDIKTFWLIRPPAAPANTPTIPESGSSMLHASTGSRALLSGYAPGTRVRLAFGPSSEPVPTRYCGKPLVRQPFSEHSVVELFEVRPE